MTLASNSIFEIWWVVIGSRNSYPILARDCLYQRVFLLFAVAARKQLTDFARMKALECLARPAIVTQEGASAIAG